MWPPRPAISVITPAFNRRAVLARSVASVQRQTIADWEHIIVDDGSTDGTRDFVRGLGDPRIRCHRLDRWRGANAARNAGIELARAPWLTFLDSDDEYLPQRLENVSAAAEHRTPDLLLSSFQTMKRGQPQAAANPSLDLSGEELERALMTHSIFIAGSCITVRRKLLQRVGGFAPGIRRMQDRELLLRLSRQSGARLLATADWIKHPSADSISGQRRGYVAALGELVAAHPDLARRYREVIGYHLARRILADLLRGRLVLALRSLRENRAAPALAFSWRELIRGYAAGSAQRRMAVAELHERGERPRILPFAQPLKSLARQPAALSRAA